MLRFAGLLASALQLAAPALAAGSNSNSGGSGGSVGGGLPGGASSLQESYGNWTVGCRMQQVKGKAYKLCSMSQVQTEKSSGKRVLEVDVEPAPGGAIATLIQPFGLALPKGVKLQVRRCAGAGAALRHLPAGRLRGARADRRQARRDA